METIASVVKSERTSKASHNRPVLEFEEKKMAFVNEDINTPERIREFDTLKLISPVNRKPPERWRWTVDRARGFYLVSLGGGFSEVPKIFALIIPEGRIQIEGSSTTKGGPYDRSGEIEWQISRVQIPRKLSPRAAELMSLVREALTAHGITFENDWVRNVQISLPSPTFV